MPINKLNEWKKRDLGVFRLYNLNNLKNQNSGRISLVKEECSRDGKIMSSVSSVGRARFQALSMSSRKRCMECGKK